MAHQYERMTVWLLPEQIMWLKKSPGVSASQLIRARIKQLMRAQAVKKFNAQSAKPTKKTYDP